MTNKQLQDYLSKFPDEIPIKLRAGRNIIDFTEENIMLTAVGAYFDDEEHELQLGDGERYLLVNPIII